MMKFQFVRLCILPLIGMVASVSGYGQSNAVNNPGFESGVEGSTPPGWYVDQRVFDAGYTVQISKQNPKEGEQCAVISLVSRKTDGFGNMMQSIDAAGFRGKRVRFKAAVRYEAGDGPGQTALWLRVDKTNGQQGFFDNMGRRPITAPNWAFYEIVGKVDADAQSINFGLMLMGSGRAWLDSVSLRLAEEDEEPVVKARALSDRGLANLVAFTKLFGYVRHFHPSDAVEKANWDLLAQAGVPAIEDAADPADLAQRLEAFFKPLAPTVQIFETGKPPAKPAVSPPTGGGPYYVVSWDNVGFGGGVRPANQNPYRDRRVFALKPAGAIPKGSPNPAEPLEADLGGGVSCRVPLALFATAESALPHTSPPPAPKGVRTIPTGDDRTTRLADVVIAWNIYEHFYPYSDVVKTDWAAVLRQSLTSAATDLGEREFLDTLRRLVSAAKDGHGYVGHASDDANASVPLIAEWVEGKFVVTSVALGLDQVKIGDEIVMIDNQPVEKRWADAEQLISGATEQWRRWRGQDVLLRGPEGSTVSLQIKRGSAAPFLVALRRSNVIRAKEKRPKPIEELKVGYWYVDLEGTRLGMPDYQQALHDLSTADGIVFDMRGYPNDVAMDVIRRIAKTPITSALWNTPKVVKPDHQDMQFVQSRWPMADPLVPRFRGKIAFITDGRAISYAESIMGIVENYKLGSIVGEPTAGTNGDVNPFALPGDYTVVFTGLKVLKHDGSQHHGIGIQPTVPVHRTIAGVTAGKDELLDKALEVVRG